MHPMPEGAALRRVHACWFLSRAARRTCSPGEGASMARRARAAGMAARGGSASTAPAATRRCGGGAGARLAVAKIASWRGSCRRACAWRGESTAVAVRARASDGFVRAAGRPWSARTSGARRAHGAAHAGGASMARRWRAADRRRSHHRGDPDGGPGAAAARGCFLGGSSRDLRGRSHVSAFPETACDHEQTGRTGPVSERLSTIQNCSGMAIDRGVGFAKLLGPAFRPCGGGQALFDK